MNLRNFVLAFAALAVFAVSTIPAEAYGHHHRHRHHNHHKS